MTVGLAFLLFDERPGRSQMLGAAVAVVGMAVIGWARYQGAALAPFMLTIAAAFFWSAGNILGKKAGRADMFAFTVWSSLAPVAPLFLLSAAFEGDRLLPALARPSLTLAISVVALSYAGTLFGFGLWARLLAHYPAARVAPFALLVPVVGMLAGRLVFNEPMSAIEASGGLLVMAGLAINVFGDRWLK